MTFEQAGAVKSHDDISPIVAAGLAGLRVKSDPVGFRNTIVIDADVARHLAGNPQVVAVVSDTAGVTGVKTSHAKLCQCAAR